ncbi:hypothetical protein CHUAL_000954 [Chamberlinius hualienensis]
MGERDSAREGIKTSLRIRSIVPYCEWPFYVQLNVDYAAAKWKKLSMTAVLSDEVAANSRKRLERVCVSMFSMRISLATIYDCPLSFTTTCEHPLTFHHIKRSLKLKFT